MEASSSSVAQRARDTTADDQQGLFDREVENDVLLRALERREKRKDERSTAQQNFKNADDAAKGMIAELEMGEDEVVRIGRFKVTNRKVEGGTDVSFTTSPRTQLSISAPKDWS